MQGDSWSPGNFLLEMISGNFIELGQQRPGVAMEVSSSSLLVQKLVVQN
jgi:hypothetical protein